MGWVSVDLQNPFDPIILLFFVSLSCLFSWCDFCKIQIALRFSTWVEKGNNFIKKHPSKKEILGDTRSSHLLAITENHSQKMCKRVQLHLPNPLSPCCGTSTTCKWVELLAIFTTTLAMSRPIDLWTIKGNPALQKQRGPSTNALMLF